MLEMEALPPRCRMHDRGDHARRAARAALLVAGPGVIVPRPKKPASTSRLIAELYSRYWELKSWDAFQIPKPFSVVDVHLQPLEKIPDTDSPEAFEAQRLRLEQIMRASHHLEHDAH